MERGAPLMKKLTRAVCTAFLLGMVSFQATGCLSGIKEPYDLEQAVGNIGSAGAKERYADGFASDLCVVEDESLFHQEEVTRCV